MSIDNLTPTQLRHAASLMERIAKLRRKLDHINDGKAGRPGPKPGRRRRTFSAAGIARIRAAQKARWAKFHAAAKGR